MSHCLVWLWVAFSLTGPPLGDSLASSGQDLPKRADHPDSPRTSRFVPTDGYATRTVQGWTIHVNRALLKTGLETGPRALALLDAKLAEVRQAVPPRAVAQIQKVPIWLGVDDGHAPCSEYHPSAAWLRANGLNPDKAKCVEIGNAQRFLDWSGDQPAMVLHELAHAYHDRVLGFELPALKEAYQRALRSGDYDHVSRRNGRKARAYALTNVQEFFAEGTEAYFGRNDFYPFSRADLERHDPALARLLGTLWTEGSSGSLHPGEKLYLPGGGAARGAGSSAR